jgi:hypothetical protein
VPLKSFSRASYVCESQWSTVITEFKLDVAGLGDKQPRTGHVRMPFCPICPVNVPNTGLHLLFTCASLTHLRRETGISSFVNLSMLKGKTLEETYKLFVNGCDWNENSVSKSDYLERGKCMNDMRDMWLSLW